MQSFGLAFDHFGLATRDADKTLTFLAGLGYRTPESVHDQLQRVNVVLCEHAAMPAVEVIFAATSLVLWERLLPLAGPCLRTYWQLIPG